MFTEEGTSQGGEWRNFVGHTRHQVESSHLAAICQRRHRNNKAPDDHRRHLSPLKATRRQYRDIADAQPPRFGKTKLLLQGAAWSSQ